MINTSATEHYDNLIPNPHSLTKKLDNSTILCYIVYIHMWFLKAISKLKLNNFSQTQNLRASVANEAYSVQQ